MDFDFDFNIEIHYRGIDSFIVVDKLSMRNAKTNLLSIIENKTEAIQRAKGEILLITTTLYPKK